MGLKDRMVALFSIFPGTAILFSIMSVPIYIPTNNIGGSPIFHKVEGGFEEPRENRQRIKIWLLASHESCLSVFEIYIVASQIYSHVNL